MLERLLGALGEAEVVGAREVLRRPVDAPGCEQLLGADDAQRFAELVADEILPAVPAREREIRDVGVMALPEPRDEPRVLIVRMRRDDEHPRAHP